MADITMCRGENCDAREKQGKSRNWEVLKMSLKQIWIAQCDLCGKKENARITTGQYNEKEYTLPEGWGYGYNKNMHLCPKCSKRITKEVCEP